MVLNKIHGNDEKFDGVLVDAPCSCSGTWRRNSEARWIALDQTCQRAAKNQLEILKKASAKVKLGGILVYATCSMSQIENEQVVEKFLDEHSDFSLDPIIHPLTGEKISGLMTVKSWPENCDAMFAARMIRKKN